MDTQSITLALLVPAPADNSPLHTLLSDAFTLKFHTNPDCFEHQQFDFALIDARLWRDTFAALPCAVLVDTPDAIPDEAPEFVLHDTITPGIIKRIVKNGLARRRLEQREHHFEQIVDATTDGMLVISPRGEVLYCNQSGRSLLEHPVNHLGMTGSSWVSGDQLVIETRDPNGEMLVAEILVTDFTWEERPALLITIHNITRSYSAEQQSTLLARVIEESQHLIALTDIDETITYINDAGIHLLGLSDRQQVIGKKLSDLPTPQASAWIQQEVLPTVLEKGSWRGEQAVRRPDGSVIDVDQSMVLLRAVDGSPLGIATHITDITARRSAEKVLVNLNEHLQDIVAERVGEISAIINGIPDYIYVISSHENRVVYCNHRFARIFGLTPENVNNRSIVDLFGAEMGVYFIEQNRSVFESGQIQHYEETIEIEGELRQFDTYKVPLRRTNGEIYALVGTSRDISELVQAQRAVTESEIRMRTLIQQLPAAFVGLFDLNLRLILAGGQTLENMPESDVIGKSIAEVFGQEADPLIRLYQRALAGEVAESEIEWQERVYIARTAPVRGVSGEIIGGMAISQEITERKRAEDSLKTALAREREINELRSRLISMLSHDFRTPIAVILSAIGMLNKYGARMSPEQAKDRFQAIQSAATELHSMVDDAIAVGRGDSAGFPYHPAPFNLLEMVEEILHEMQMTSQHHIILQYHCTSRTLIADHHLIRMILTNLISNAMKYSPQHSSIAVTLSNSDTMLTIHVADQGIGIPEADQKYLFTMFWRGSNVSNVRGNGIGLSIVNQAVKSHGGEIEFKSVVGQGTTFTIHLPIS